MTMKVLVTGGAGFIGSHIVDRLIDDGHSVRILDNLDPQVHGNTTPGYINEAAELVICDVRNTAMLETALEDIDIIFHEAASVGVGQSMYLVKKYADNNVIGTANLLEALIRVKHSVRKLIVASSMSIYGEGAYKCEDCGVVQASGRGEKQLMLRRWEHYCPRCGKPVVAYPTSENKPLEPTSIYAITKRDQEEMCLSIGRAYGIPTVALRYFNVYGPRQSLSNPYTGVCAIFSSAIKHNRRPMIFEDGLQSRDFVSVHDVVQANMLAMKNPNADYEAFNVGTGMQIPVLDVARILIGLHGKDFDASVLNQYRKGDIRHCYPNISKIRNKLGYSPKVDFATGMGELVDWTRERESIDGHLGSYNELLANGLVTK